MKFFYINIIILLIIFFTSCGMKSKSPKNEEYSEMKTYDMNDTTEKDKKTDDSSNPDNDTEHIEKLSTNRKIIRSGTITYKINNFTGIEKKINKYLKEYNGYISSSEYNNNYMSIQVKIPSENFDDFLFITDDNALGEITNKNITSLDITKNFYDTKIRIDNKKVQIERVQNYITRAKDLDDLLKFEAKLNELTNELELLEGDYQNMAFKVAYSTLVLNFYLAHSTAVSRNWPSIKKGFSDLGYNMVKFFFTILMVIIYFIIIALTIIILLSLLAIIGGFIFYLTFGKIGLLKKYFKILAGKK